MPIRILTAAVLAVLPAAHAAGQDQTPLTLGVAVSRALEGSPALSSAHQDVEIQSGRYVQARAFPNPELSFEVEEFGGTGARRGFDAAEYTASISQLFEIGGKRGNRIDITSYGRETAARDYERARLDVILNTTQSVVAVAAARERFDLAVQSFELAEQLAETVQKRIKAGQVSPTEQTRADLAVSAARLARAEAERDLGVARQILWGRWGETPDDSVAVAFALDHLSEPKTRRHYADKIDASPDVTRWESDLARSDAAIAFERSQRIPDLTVNFGGTKFDEDGSQALRLGVSLPLPLFDWNTGNIAAARAEKRRTENERTKALLDLRVRLDEAYIRLSAAYTNATSIQNDVLPAATDAYDVTVKSYEAGRLGFVDLAQAQSVLIDVQRAYIDALENYHSNFAVVERLAAEPSPDL